MDPWKRQLQKLLFEERKARIEDHKLFDAYQTQVLELAKQHDEDFERGLVEAQEAFDSLSYDLYLANAYITLIQRITAASY